MNRKNRNSGISFYALSGHSRYDLDTGLSKHNKGNLSLHIPMHNNIKSFGIYLSYSLGKVIAGNSDRWKRRKGRQRREGKGREGVCRKRRIEFPIPEIYHAQ